MWTQISNYYKYYLIKTKYRYAKIDVHVACMHSCGQK